MEKSSPQGANPDALRAELAEARAQLEECANGHRTIAEVHEKLAAERALRVELGKQYGITAQALVDVTMRVAELEELKEKAESLERQLQCAETHVAAARAENTRLGGEVEQAKAERQSAITAHDTMADLLNAELARNTPLKAQLAAVEPLLRAARRYAAADRAFHGSGETGLGDALRQRETADADLRAAAAALPLEGPAVTGTTSDSVSIRQPCEHGNSYDNVPCPDCPDSVPRPNP